MALCQAITQRDFHPCKNLARHGHDTCAVHKAFFNKRSWFKNFILGKNKTHDCVLLGYSSPSKTYRLEKHVREVLTTGRVEITKEDIRSLPATSDMSDVFLILCELPHVDPNWNKRLVCESIRIFHQILMGYMEFLQSYNPYKVMRQRLAPLLENPHMGFGRILRYMITVNETPNLGGQRLMRQPTSYFDEVFQMFFLEYKDDYTWYSKEALTELMVPEGVSPDYFHTSIVPLLKRRARQIRMAKKMRMDPIKERLVANVFHPKNVARWLEEGGFEELERRFE